MAFLIDTNVISEIRKAQPHDSVVAWFDHVAEPDLFLSVMTIGEVRRGVESLRSRDPDQARVLDEWTDSIVSTYDERIAPFDAEVAEEWGRLNARRPLPAVDGIIAATAKVNEWTVATRNTKDFAGTGVAVVNPFEWKPNDHGG